MREYLSATRHPFVCLLFVVPLVAVYEYGVHALGGDRPETLRNGADAWLRWGLEKYGLVQIWVAPLIVVGFFFLWSAASWGSRPKEPLAALFGMLIECGLFAGILWAVSANFRPILDRLGIELAMAGDGPWHQSAQARMMVRYVGAGIYEEVIFRLGLFTLIYFLLRIALLPSALAGLLAAIAAALLFAAAHHVGDNGETPIVPLRFAFRAVAGLYFTLLYVGRGFGIAVGTHAAYDVLVGLSNP
jgi:hypothetical protein